jgi:hypothetical protein
MKRMICVASVAALLSLTAGCFYSRIHGSAHDKLYRGKAGEIGKAVQAALTRHGYAVSAPESSGATLKISGTLAPNESVSVSLRPQEEDLVDTRISSDVDWRKAAEIHQWIARELGVLYRREP